MPNPSNTKLIRLEIAKTGTFGAQGSIITAEDLKEVVANFDGKCPVSLGHYMTKQDWWPQWGNVENITLEEKEDGEAVLIGDISVNEVLYEAMKEGFYPSWSVSIPQRASDGKRYLHHLAFIGATPPKIRDLKLFSVADGTAPENSIKVEGEGFSFGDYASYSYADMGIESFHEAGEEESEKPEKKNEKSEDPKNEEEDEKDESGKNDFADSPAMKTARKIFNSAIKSKLDEALKHKLPPAMMDKVHEFADLACDDFDFADGAEQPAIISLFLDIVNAMKSIPAVKTGRMDFADVEGAPKPSDSKIDTRRMAMKF